MPRLALPLVTATFWRDTHGFDLIDYQTPRRQASS
jgi:hypothetical protein